jgi:hypothetical protein
LFYPHWSFVSRLVTIEKFLRKVVPLIQGATHIVKDLVEFIRPHFLKCESMSCGEGPTPDFPIHNKELVQCILDKFLSPAISNYANYISGMEKPKITFKKGKPLVRKYRNFS